MIGTVGISATVPNIQCCYQISPGCSRDIELFRSTSAKPSSTGASSSRFRGVRVSPESGCLRPGGGTGITSGLPGSRGSIEFTAFSVPPGMPAALLMFTSQGHENVATYLFESAACARFEEIPERSPSTMKVSGYETLIECQLPFPLANGPIVYLSGSESVMFKEHQTESVEDSPP